MLNLKLHYYLVQRNVFIALCALAQAFFVQTFLATQKVINIQLLYVALASTWIAYEYYRARNSWVHYIIIVSVVVVTIYYSTLTNAGLLGCVGGIAWLYNNWIMLRNHIIIKNIVVTTCWTVVNVVLQQLDFKYNYILIVQQFLFVLALTFIYDNKDVDADNLSNTPTLATVIGRRYTTLIAFLILLVSLCALFLFNIHYTGFYMLSCISIMVFIVEYITNPPAYYYYYVIDGLLILQLILCWR